MLPLKNSILAAVYSLQISRRIMSQTSTFRYIPELDSLRGLFCFTVLVAHVPLIFAKLPFAWEGMQMFFIMSGYLICSILLKQKEKRLGIYAKNFYIRRILRIVPLYIVYISLVWLVVYSLRNVEVMKQTRMVEEFQKFGVYLFTFTYNFKEL